MKSAMFPQNEVLQNELILRRMLHSQFQHSPASVVFAPTTTSPVLSRASSPFSPWINSTSILCGGGVAGCGSPSSTSASTAALMEEYVSRVMLTKSIARSIYELEHKIASSKTIHRSYPIKRTIQTKYSYGACGYHPYGRSNPTATRRSKTFASTGIKPLGPPPQLPKLPAWRKVPEEQQEQAMTKN